ncbi:MAG TPA: class I SAM-dependent methyltransferase, partial [SAR202 cluster bacterium]|nr:class I SAM-dependent methyltransferase [SAR202 cluster bacterium]
MTSASNTPYDPWADVYDAVYSYVRDDIPFYVEEALATGGPVLELGCGTGRVAIPITQAGVEVVGVDYSEAMLAVANRKARQIGVDPAAMNLVHGDMRDFE